MADVSLKIRRYEEYDHDEVWALHNLALQSTGAHVGNGPWDADLHHIRSVYIDGGGEFLVGLQNGMIVAMGAMKRSSEDAAEIKRMRVHPEFQRRGFGRAILRSLEARAIELRYRTLHLDTTVQQVAAQKLYSKAGYVETGRRKLDGFDVILYERPLSIR